MAKTATTSPLSSPEQLQSSDRNDQPKYTGVRKRKWGKWVSEIRLPNSRERIWLGSYDRPEKAARAFDAALYCLRGRNARFNFPDNPPDIEGGGSLSPHEIQAVAARFANEHPTPITTSNVTTSTTGDQNDVSSTSAGQVVDSRSDHTAIDWSFLNMLDSNNEVGQDFGFYAGLDNMNMGSEYYPPSTPPPSIFEDENMDSDQNGDASFSHQSFLWNF